MMQFSRIAASEAGRKLSTPSARKPDNKQEKAAEARSARGSPNALLEIFATIPHIRMKNFFERGGL